MFWKPGGSWGTICEEERKENQHLNSQQSSVVRVFPFGWWKGHSSAFTCSRAAFMWVFIFFLLLLSPEAERLSAQPRGSGLVQTRHLPLQVTWRRLASLTAGAPHTTCDISVRYFTFAPHLVFCWLEDSLTESRKIVFDSLSKCRFIFALPLPTLFNDSNNKKCY